MKKLYLLLLLFVIGCQKANFEQEVEPQKGQNVISQQQAEALLNEVGALSITKSGLNAPYATVANMRTIKDEAGNPVYHIVNYAPEGFVILAADNRIAPILAYSQTGEFEVSSDINSGLAGWMEGEKEQVQYVRASNAVQSEQISTQWEPESISRMLGINNFPIEKDDPDDNMKPEPCYCSKEVVGPLLPISINWGQWPPYNANTPMVADNNGIMVHAPAGCVPVAMGQIMAYHSYPKVLTDMSVIAAMLVEIGSQVNIDYDFNSSGASGNKIAPAFKNKFGYKSADYATYDYEVVISNLRSRKPVILCGGSKGGSWLFPEYQKGHAWVCDGFDGQTVCPDHSYRGYGYSTLYLYMNWGWNGSNNGFYSFNNWTPPGYSFNYLPTMITNITTR